MKATFQTLILAGLALGPILGVASSAFGQFAGTWEGEHRCNDLQDIVPTFGDPRPLIIEIADSGSGLRVGYDLSTIGNPRYELETQFDLTGFSGGPNEEHPDTTISFTITGASLTGTLIDANDAQCEFEVFCETCFAEEPEEEDDACLATTFLWDAAGGGNFGDDSRWLDGETPGSDGSAVFEGRVVDDGTVTLNQDTTLDSILVENDTLILDLNSFSLNLEERTGCFVAMEVGDSQESSLTILGASGITAGSLQVGRRSSQSGLVEILDSTLLGVPTGECVIGAAGTGTIDVFDRGDLTCQSLVVGEKPGSVGVVTVTGQDSELSLNDLTIGKEAGASGSVTLDGDTDHFFSKTVTIGDAGTGTLVMRNGAFIGTEPDVVTKIAVAPGSDGVVIIEDVLTQWGTGQLEVGVDGTGDLFIQNSSAVLSTVALVGALSQGVGQVAVTDGGSWEVDRAIFVGTLGKGTVSVAPGSSVDTPQFLLGPNGRLEVLDVEITGPSSLGAARAGVRLQEIGESAPGLTTQSLILEEGAELVAESVTLGPGGQLAGDGEFDFDLINPGELAPGIDECTSGPFVINGDYTQQSSGQLLMKLGGREQGVDHDVLIVNGKATLFGILNVSAINDFQPQPGDEFEILTAETVDGQFDSIEGSGEYEAAYDSDRVVLTVVAAPTEVAAPCADPDSDAGSPPSGGTGQGSRGAGGFCGVGIVPMVPLMVCGLCFLGRSSAWRAPTGSSESRRPSVHVREGGKKTRRTNGSKRHGAA